MAKQKTDKYIVTTSYTEEEAERKGLTERSSRQPGKPFAERLLWLDGERIEGASYGEVTLFETGFKSEEKPVEPHAHEFDEIIAFIGTNPKNPHDLGGEVELWLDGEKHILTKT